MRWVLVALLVGVSVRADVIRFENGLSDLDQFSVNNGAVRGTGYLAGTIGGVGGSGAVRMLTQPIGTTKATYPVPLVASSSIYETSIDFMPVPDTLFHNSTKVFLGFSDSSRAMIWPNVAGGAVVVLSAFSPSTPTQFWAELATVNHPDTITSASSASVLVTIDPTHWYQMTADMLRTPSGNSIWGSIYDIGTNGTSPPTLVWSTDQSNSLAVPSDTFVSPDAVYSGFVTSTLVPIDNFYAAPEPSVVLPLAAACLLRRRRA